MKLHPKALTHISASYAVSTYTSAVFEYGQLCHGRGDILPQVIDGTPFRLLDLRDIGHATVKHKTRLGTDIKTAV